MRASPNRHTESSSGTYAIFSSAITVVFRPDYLPVGEVPDSLSSVAGLDLDSLPDQCIQLSDVRFLRHQPQHSLGLSGD